MMVREGEMIVNKYGKRFICLKDVPDGVKYITSLKTYPEGYTTTMPSRQIHLIHNIKRNPEEFI